MTTNRLDGEQYGEILIPREDAADQLIKHLEQVNELPLLSIHGPSGVGKTDLAGPVLTQRLKKISGKSNPKLLRVPVTPDDSALDIALQITDLIIDNHSEFRSRKSAKVFRDKMRRSVRRAPAEAAEKLRSMMRCPEKGKFDIRKIQLVICLDSVDKLFEKRARCGSDLSKSAICGDQSDPVGFLNKLVGMNTILFSIVHRSWVTRDVRTILDLGGIGGERRFDLLLSYPNAEESEKVVRKLLIPIKEQCENHGEIDEYGDLLTDSLRKNPALVGMIPSALISMFRDRDGGLSRSTECVERYLQNNGLVGELAAKADEIYLQQNTNNKLALEEVFSNLNKGDGRLLIKDVVMSDELWAIALNFVENRILAIDGRSYRNARFITTHKGLLSVWQRAVSWTGEKRSVGITQLRKLDDKALSWELAEHNKALLIQSEAGLEDARLILNDSELSSQLSPLTREYLTKSLKPKRDLKKILVSRMVWIPLGGIMALLFLLAVIIVFIPEEGYPPEVALTEAVTVVEEEVVPSLPVEEEVTEPGVSKRFLEGIKVEPVTSELLASAERLSGAADRISEEVPLLSELELIPLEVQPEPVVPAVIPEVIEVTEVAALEAAVEVAAMPVERPVITKWDLMTHIDQLKREYAGTEYTLPIGLPSAQALFDRGVFETAVYLEQKQTAEPLRKLATISISEPVAIVPEPRVIASAGLPVPEEALKTATGYVEKLRLSGNESEDQDRLYMGLTNRRLEIGGAEAEILHVSSDSTWRQIVNTMGSAIAEGNTSLVLDSLRSFHEKSVLYPDQIGDLQVSELKDLVSHLGKIALVQQDRIAMKAAWKLELASQNFVELGTGLRMLMARVALNANRDEEAVAYLAQTKIQDQINKESIDRMKAAVGWHFNKGGKARDSFRDMLPPQASAN